MALFGVGLWLHLTARTEQHVRNWRYLADPMQGRWFRGAPGSWNVALTQLPAGLGGTCGLPQSPSPAQRCQSQGKGSRHWIEAPAHAAGCGHCSCLILALPCCQPCSEQPSPTEAQAAPDPTADPLSQERFCPLLPLNTSSSLILPCRGFTLSKSPLAFPGNAPAPHCCPAWSCPPSQRERSGWSCGPDSAGPLRVGTARTRHRSPCSGSSCFCSSSGPLHGEGGGEGMELPQPSPPSQHCWDPEQEGIAPGPCWLRLAGGVSPHLIPLPRPSQDLLPPVAAAQPQPWPWPWSGSKVCHGSAGG